MRTNCIQKTISVEDSATEEFYLELDPGIRQIVRILSGNGVETCQSCAASGPHGTRSGYPAGLGPHSYPDPTVEFTGSYADGFRALSIALAHGLPVSELRRVWNVTRQGEPSGPIWALIFCLHPNNLLGWLAPDAETYSRQKDASQGGGA